MSSVDVVVPCYNYGHFLRECVQSILSQTGVEARVLILDDASPDHTAEVATELTKEDSRITFVRHTTNRGHIATYNAGIEWASGDYFLLLSADDYLLSGALDRAATLMNNHPEVGFTFGSAIELRNGGAETQVTPIPGLLREAGHLILTGRKFIELSGCRNIVPTPTALVRTSMQKSVGGYRPELPHAGDMEMWFRLAARMSVGVIEPCQAVQRKHSSNMSHGYLNKNCLPDLHQRKDVVDVFFTECGDMLADAKTLHDKVLWSLGYEAVGRASAAFNDGELELSDQISEFAVNSCPGVNRSLPWMKLAYKRRIGLRAWRTLQPYISKVGQFRSKIKWWRNC